MSSRVPSSTHPLCAGAMQSCPSSCSRARRGTSRGRESISSAGGAVLSIHLTTHGLVVQVEVYAVGSRAGFRRLLTTHARSGEEKGRRGHRVRQWVTRPEHSAHMTRDWWTAGWTAVPTAEC